MSEKSNQISSNIIKQIFLILIIVVFTGLIFYNLSTFIPSLLGALTLYVISRNYNFKLQEEKKWKPMWASLFIIFISLVVLIIPLYFMAESVIGSLGNTQSYMGKLNGFLKEIQDFIYNKIGIDVLSKTNIQKIQETVGKISTTALSGTFNTITVIGSMFFILYFMLLKPRAFERIVTAAIPLKRSNKKLIGEKFRKLVIANAVGIPVVALGQGLVALVGYLIFGAPNPFLLFALTAFASMLPIVGAAIVYVPIGIYMIATGDTSGGIWFLLYCFILVGLTDNILRFTLLKRLENIHPLITVFGIILGINLFGFIGLVFGPILMSMTVLLIQIYRDEFSQHHTNTPAIANNNNETNQDNT